MKIQKPTSWSYFRKSSSKSLDSKMQDKVQIRSLDSTRIGLHHQVQTHQIKHQGKEQMVLSKVEIPVYLWTILSSNWSRHANSWIWRTGKCSSWTSMSRRWSRRMLSCKCGCSSKRAIIKCSSSSSTMQELTSWGVRQQRLETVRIPRCLTSSK